MISKNYADYAWEQAAAILAVDSPTGFTQNAAQWAKNAFEKLGFSATITTKGGVLVDLGGEDEQDALLLAAHADTLGAMVAEVKGNGRLRLTPLGGMSANNGEAERIAFRGGRYSQGLNTGVFKTCLDDPRSYSGDAVGFRSAYYKV